MRTLSLAAMGLAAMAVSLYSQQGQAPPHTFLKVGDMAPDFTLPSTAGGSVTLSSFRGKNNVLLAFFPAAFSGG
jgi:peroxiredoxin